MPSDKQKKTKEEKKAVQPIVNIGMVGHVDHGKTSLTEALTGKWTDTHSEELKRGISIRLGYADASFYKCPSCNGAEAYTTKPKCPNCGKQAVLLRKVSFIDAPGHETLMTTMLSGAALMQGAILVIAANEPCPQPSTAEHLMALSIAGVRDIVVAQNKIDLVDKKQAIENHGQIIKFLKDYGYENVEIVPTAAHFGTNIDVLIEAIEKTIKTPKFDANASPKMYIVRSFDINKPGTEPAELKGGVVGGSLIQGVLRKGDEIEISPGLDGEIIRTKCIEFNISEGMIEEAQPCGLIAIRTSLDPSLARNDQMRGQIVAKPGTLPKPTKRAVLEIHMLDRLLFEKSVAEIKTNDDVVLTIGTLTVLGRIDKRVEKGCFDVETKSAAVFEKDRKIAISKRQNAQWRLVAYGICR